jgi:hypothetical protein
VKIEIGANWTGIEEFLIPIFKLMLSDFAFSFKDNPVRIGARPTFAFPAKAGFIAKAALKLIEKKMIKYLVVIDGCTKGRGSTGTHRLCKGRKRHQ